MLQPNGKTKNTATVLNALADPDGPNGPIGSVIPLLQKSASDEVRILKPTGVRLTGLNTEAVDGAVLVSWETLTEFNIIGFNVLRAQRVSGGGDYATMNEEFILAEYAGADSGRKYEYLDESVEAGTTYEYMLEVLRADGGVIHLQLPMITTEG